MENVLKARWIRPGGQVDDALAIRFEVFCDEQGYGRDEEVDSLDACSWHVVLYDKEGIPSATGRVIDEGNGIFSIGRVCVAKRLRGMQAGRKLMELLMDKCWDLRAGSIQLSAQVRAQGFYERLGFVAGGAVYMDGHVPHIHMTRARPMADSRPERG
ncbi:GNAT family N-acetyltransferase [Solibaculum mannosilyticum]|uniref:GNAT family N-acetyltransferase n=1 Tax=Solibaculum mannosilyticum TaxID=2780922 RepID=UPI0034AC3124